MIHDLQAVGRASVSAGTERQGKTAGLSGLSANHLWFLAALREGPQSVRSLADGLGVSSPAATQLANRLEEHGLIRRHRDPLDRRVVLVDCSPAGERLVDLIVGDFSVRLGNALSRLTDEEVRKVFEGCRLFSRAIGEA
ncbi:MAG: MarR family transcriptional regulator [Rubrobacteraceae bacterium]